MRIPSTPSTPRPPRFRPPSIRSWLKLIALSAVVLSGIHSPESSLQPGLHYPLPRGLRVGVCRDDGHGQSWMDRGRLGPWTYFLGVWEGERRSFAGDGRAEGRGPAAGWLWAGAKVKGGWGEPAGKWVVGVSGLGVDGVVW